MTAFEFTPIEVCTDSLQFDYYIVPWDSEILTRPVAQIDGLRILDKRRARQDFSGFEAWHKTHHVFLCSARIPHCAMDESQFLEERGFRFIELNYQPELSGLEQIPNPSKDIQIQLATLDDRSFLVDLATSVFRHGRFHQDPRLGIALGNERYGQWMLNSFERESQQVYKCTLSGKTAAFFVIERPSPETVFWSLVAMVPEFSGRGLAKPIWGAMLDVHRRDGVKTVKTSITPHNVPVFNLYTRLGFSFPMPSMTFHRVTNYPSKQSG